MRPPGPVPVMLERFTPWAAAIFLAGGEAFTRAPGVRAAAGVLLLADVAVGAAAPAEVVAAGFAAATGGSSPSAGGFSFFPSRRSIGVPQATFSPAGMRSL